MKLKIKIIFCFMLFLSIIAILSITEKATANVKYASHLDTNLDNAIFDKNGIHIEGWRLSTEPNSKIQVFIDGQEVSEDCIKYSYKYDLISLVGGYGTYEENPTPNYDIDIPTEDIKDGKHSLQIQFVLEDGTVLENIEKSITIQKVKHASHLDTNLDNVTFDKKGIHIEGWKLATEPNTKIIVLIDGQKVSEEYTKYSYKYDLISLVGGYGTYEENPTPNYDIDIPTKDIKDGKHSLQIQFVLEDGTVLENIEKSITIQKVKHASHLDTNLDNVTFDKKGIHIEGWKLATEPNTKIIVLIDGQKVSEEYTKYSYKYDLISLVGGYGTYEENPTPNYDIDIPTKDIKNGKHSLQIQFILEDGTVLENIEKNITIQKLRYASHLDTNLDNATFDKKGIHIEGWRLATEPNTKIIVLIDGQKVSEEYTKYSYKYDLISIVKGYGTYEENPTPNYDIDIPTKDIKDGKHSLQIQFILDDETVLENTTKTIYIDKSIKSYLQIDTNLQEIVFNERKGIHIEGWKLATEPNTKLIISIDGKEISQEYIKYSYKYDLISIVKGYGKYEENPTPNYDIDIPVEELTKQKHIIKIEFVTENKSDTLKSIEFEVNYGGTYKGIDVSSHNGVIDWNGVKQSGLDFAMIRIGYRGYRSGKIVIDEQALYNIREAKARGIKIGVYFFTQAVNVEEAQEEALWVVSQLHQNHIYIDYPIAIDTEDSGARKNGYLPGRADLIDNQTRTTACRAFSDIIKYYGYTPAVYASSDWFNNKLKFSDIQCYDIWLAHYTYDENILSNFKGEYQIWQYTDSGQVLGISTKIDMNVCYKKY